jgi:hypothetical protein
MMAARLLIKRINKAGTIAGWDTARKVTELYMCLHDGFITWWELLKADSYVDLADWEVGKKEFFKAYKPKYSALTTGANFADLLMKPGETMNAYHIWVQMAYKRLHDSKPTTMATTQNAADIMQGCETREVNPASLESVAAEHSAQHPAQKLMPAKRQFIENNSKLREPEEYRDKYLKVILSNHKAVSQDKFDLGRTDTLMHEIALKMAKLI